MFFIGRAANITLTSPSDPSVSWMWQSLCREMPSKMKIKKKRKAEFKNPTCLFYVMFSERSDNWGMNEAFKGPEEPSSHCRVNARKSLQYCFLPAGGSGHLGITTLQVFSILTTWTTPELKYSWVQTCFTEILLFSPSMLQTWLEFIVFKSFRVRIQTSMKVH